MSSNKDAIEKQFENNGTQENQLLASAFIDVKKINNSSLLRDKLDRFAGHNDPDLINRLASAEVKTFIKNYLCCSESDKVPKYYKHQDIAAFAFKYFNAEEIFVLLDKCYKEFDTVTQERVLNSSSSGLSLETINEILRNNGIINVTHKIDKPLAELKAYIFILELIRVKSPMLDCGMFDHYVSDLKNKFNALYEKRQYTVSLDKFLENTTIKIETLKLNSVAILEFNSDGKNKNQHLIEKTTKFISSELKIPVVAIPEKTKLYIIEDKNDDNSIDGLEV